MTNQEKKLYEDPEVLRQIIDNLKGKKFRLDCGHYAKSIVMRREASQI